MIINFFLPYFENIQYAAFLYMTNNQHIIILIWKTLLSEQLYVLKNY